MQMRKKGLLFVIFLVTAILIVVITLIIVDSSRVGSFTELVRLSESDLRLKIAWNGQEFVAPPPVEMPQSILQSRAYKRWLSRKNITTLTGLDQQGNKVEVQALGFWKDKSGVHHPIIPKITVHRPDGTLLKEATYSPDGLPDIWTIYDRDGKSKLVEVWYRTHGKPGTPFIRHVTFYNPDGTARRYSANNSQRVVWIEWELNDKGRTIKKLNGGNEFNPEFTKKTQDM
jgi:hypothetical protein